LYRRVADPAHLEEVQAALRRLLDLPEIGLVEDPQTGGFTFLSESVKPLREKRDRYMPTTAEVNQLRSNVLKGLFDPAPAASLQGAKTVRAGVRLGRTPIVAEDEEVQFRIEVSDGGAWEARRTALLTETTGKP